MASQFRALFPSEALKFSCNLLLMVTHPCNTSLSALRRLRCDMRVHSGLSAVPTTYTESLPNYEGRATHRGGWALLECGKRTADGACSERRILWPCVCR